MRFHILGIPHTVTNKQYLSCAYSQKIYKLCSMLTKLGHEVYHYGCEGSDPECTEHIDVITEELRSSTYPDDWHVAQFKFDQNDVCYKTFHTNAIKEIRKRLSPRDFLLCAWGWGHQPIAQALQEEVMVVESGIGYESTFAPYRIFESYTWMNYVYGLQNQSNGIFYDAVIPNFFNPDDFTYSDEKEDWFLYLGRLTQRKGLDIASQVVEHINGKLVIAGQGQLINEQEALNIQGDHIDFVGFADLEKRRYLLSHAKALFVPTYYLEPFGGVIIEAMLSGTPVISTDWGVFAENNLHGTTGFRCRTFDHFCWAARNIEKINPINCREWALNNFTCDRVALMYEEYFEMLHNLWSEGWYVKNDERKNLNWLARKYP